MQRRRSDEVFRVCARDAHDITPAHAISDRCHAAAPHVLGASEEFEDCAGTVSHHFVAEFRLGLYLAACLAVEPAYGDGVILLAAEFKMYSFARALIKIRDHALVPVGSHPLTD